MQYNAATYRFILGTMETIETTYIAERAEIRSSVFSVIDFL